MPAHCDGYACPEDQAEHPSRPTHMRVNLRSSSVSRSDTSGGGRGLGGAAGCVRGRQAGSEHSAAVGLGGAGAKNSQCKRAGLAQSSRLRSSLACAPAWAAAACAARPPLPLARAPAHRCQPPLCPPPLRARPAGKKPARWMQQRGATCGGGGGGGGGPVRHLRGAGVIQNNSPYGWPSPQVGSWARRQACAKTRGLEAPREFVGKLYQRCTRAVSTGLPHKREIQGSAQHSMPHPTSRRAPVCISRLSDTARFT